MGIETRRFKGKWEKLGLRRDVDRKELEEETAILTLGRMTFDISAFEHSCVVGVLFWFCIVGG